MGEGRAIHGVNMLLAIHKDHTQSRWVVESHTTARIKKQGDKWKVTKRSRKQDDEENEEKVK
jgi:hypothetical protein